MEFSKFNNGQDHLEYIQIFCFSEIVQLKKTPGDVSIGTYNSFELTDTIIAAYNEWVAAEGSDKSLIAEWMELKADEYTAFKDGFGKDYHPKVAIWSDRVKTPYYKTKLQDAFIFENYIANLLKEKYGLDIEPYLTPEGQYDLGENALGIEIKNDTLIEKYGNVYIEYQEKSRASNYEYVNSGIFKADNCKYFLIGTKDKFYIFRKSRLLEIYKEEIELRNKSELSGRGIQFKQIATSRGYVYPVENATEDMISLDEMVAEIRQDLESKT